MRQHKISHGLNLKEKKGLSEGMVKLTEREQSLYHFILN